MQTMKAQLFSEPDITVADPDTVCSPAFALKSTDCSRASVAEVSAFESPFVLAVSREASCTALCVHFDIGFENGLESPVFFSTGPKATPTHWKQTYFFLEHPLAVEAGDVIEGKLSAKKSADNPRHWEVEISYRTGTGIMHSQRYRI